MLYLTPAATCYAQRQAPAWGQIAGYWVYYLHRTRQTATYLCYADGLRLGPFTDPDEAASYAADRRHQECAIHVHDLEWGM